MIKVREIKNDSGEIARIYKDREWGEYVVKFYLLGIPYCEECDYFTNELQDAIATAKYQLKIEG